MPQLIVVTPEGDEWRLALTDDEYVIGRDPDVPVSLPHSKVSRRHARLYRRRGGDFWVEDLGSANGVVLNDSLIEGPPATPTGSRLQVGPYTLTVAPDDGAVASAYVLVGRTPPCAGQVFGLPPGTVDVGRGL